MYDITPIIEAVAALIAALITAFVIPYIRSKTTAQQQAEITLGVRLPSLPPSRFIRAAVAAKRRRHMSSSGSVSMESRLTRQSSMHLLNPLCTS